MAEGVTGISPEFFVYAFGPPASSSELDALGERYPLIPAGFADLALQVTGLVLLWHYRGELRLWHPGDIGAMDDAYEVSRYLPGAMPLGDNGGGSLLIHCIGADGAGIYLFEAGALFIEDARFLAPDIMALIERAEGAALICQSDPLDPAELGPPIFEPRDEG